VARSSPTAPHVAMPSSPGIDRLQAHVMFESRGPAAAAPSISVFRAPGRFLPVQLHSARRVEPLGETQEEALTFTFAKAQGRCEAPAG